MYYFLIIALQGFCLYHIWKTGRPFFWIFVIIFLPVIGCIIYIITQALQKDDVNKIQQEITTIINPTKKITDLQAALDFSDTFQNRINLADALLEQKQFEPAIGHYQEALKGNFKNDSYVKMQLMQCYYALGRNQDLIQEAEPIKAHPDFIKSPVSFYYAKALDSEGRPEDAQPYFDQIDRRYSNYNERVALVEHYIDSNRLEKAIEIVDEVLAEAATMGKESRRMHKIAIDKAQKLKQGL